MKARELFRVLGREPLGYKPVRARGAGSHRLLRSKAGYPDVWFAFHDNQTIPPGLVRKILVDDVGLTIETALGLI
jgi:predicted RNA binding protein YcfA (HicA-like mRNA interferase family)